MPELPEVETTKNGLEPHIIGVCIKQVNIYKRQLRWPIPLELKHLEGQKSHAISRRAKYMLWHFETGTVIMHLGMSGNMRILPQASPLKKHDHFEVIFDNHMALRFNDPRRFGAILWQPVEETSALLSALGPEPLSDEFHGDYLHKSLSKRKGAIKNLIMDNKIVVGVGNIYASESLYLSGIHPKRAANKISLVRCHALVNHIKAVLQEAIKQGGTTLKDFTKADGNPGYFAQQLNVYGREGQACYQCQGLIKRLVIGQRSSFYCSNCQH